jgi:hypothetical protein
MRVAFSMTIDPEGAMHDWVDLPEGWELIRVPTQEAVHLIGPHAYQRMLIDLCQRARPDVLVTHPPYDWLDPASAAEIRATGTLLYAYAFDDEIFAGQYNAKVRAELASLYDKYVTTREVLWATRPLPALPEVAPEFDVVLVGRAYPRRVALVASLRAAGLRVATHGDGWPEGMISRAGMLELYSRAAIVLTTADWESREVPMVKHRLLDTAMLGVFQIAQAAPDLRRYFSEYEVPSYTSSDELLARVREFLPNEAERRARARAARDHALAEHTWTRRWPELWSGIQTERKRERSFFFTAVLCALASRAESDGRVGAAAALWNEALGHDPDDLTAAAGLGRCTHDLALLRRAAEAAGPTCASSIFASLPGAGVGLGRLKLLPASAEPTMLWIAELVERDRIDEAVQVLDSLSGARARAVAATLSFGDRAELEPLRQALTRLRNTSG